MVDFRTERDCVSHPSEPGDTPSRFESKAPNAHFIPPGDSSLLVKSGMRVIEILEYFNEEARPARGLDIATKVGMPNSSANELLKTLVELGYLCFDNKTKLYFPSFRLVMLGNSFAQTYFKGNAIINLLKDLNQATGETVAVFVQNSSYMQFVARIPRVESDPERHTEGTKVAMLDSACGRALLAIKTDSEISTITKRLSGEKWPNSLKNTIDETLQIARKTRTRGFAVASPDFHPPGRGAVAIKMPIRDAPVPLILGMGHSEIGQERNIADLMRAAVARHLS